MSNSHQAGRLALLSDLIRTWLKDHNDHFIVGPTYRILGYCTEEGSRLSMYHWGGILVDDTDNSIISRTPGLNLNKGISEERRILKAADPEFFSKLDAALQRWHKKYAPTCPQERKWHS